MTQHGDLTPGNMTCSNCFSEVSMILHAGAREHSDLPGSSNPRSRGQGVNSGSHSSSSISRERRVRFNDEAADGSQEDHQPLPPGSNDMSSIQGEGTMVLSRVRPGGLRASTNPGVTGRVINERGIENLDAPQPISVVFYLIIFRSL